MSKKVFNLIFYFILLPIFLVIVLCVFCVYLYLNLPNKIINSKGFNSYVKDAAKEYSNLDLEIKNPNIVTKLSPDVDFSVDKLYLSKDDNVLINLENFKLSMDFKNVFSKEIRLKYLLADNLEIKFDELLRALNIKNESEKSSVPSDWKFDMYDSNIKLNNLLLTYNQPNKTMLKLNARDVIFDCNNPEKTMAFAFLADVYKNNNKFVNISSSVKNEVKILDDSIKIINLPLKINSSSLTLSSKIDKEAVFVNIKSSKFGLADIFSIIQSDFVVQNGANLLRPLVNPKGSVKFDVNYLNGNLSGYILPDNTQASIKDLTKLPINIQKGKIDITKDKISFVDLIGYYGKNRTNEVKISGDIKDYYKTFDSKIDIVTVISNEFLKHHLKPLISNTELYLSKPTKTKIIYKAKNNIMDIIWLAKVPKGVQFTINNSSSASSEYLTNFDRAVKGEFNINKNKLDIKDISYYIAPDIKRGVKLTPIMIFKGKTDLSGKIDNIGFSFGKPIPCEFLNIFAGDNTFKKGTIEGNMNIVFKNKTPILNADMKIDMTLLPNQRLFIKSAKLTTNNHTIDVIMDGGFKRNRFSFEGKMKNEIKPPFVIKDMKLKIDDLDIEKLLVSTATQDGSSQNVEQINSENDLADDNYFFDTNLIRIENSNLNIAKGHYKELEFSDINANMSLDEKGIMRFHSNRFNIADGISTLRGESDLKHFTHHFRFGVRDVDSNLMAKVLFNLDKEISGRAKGLLEIFTDKNLKLSGSLRFEIENGTIGKIGLVEYLLKIASVFRNPIVMISPTVIMDIVNVPEGRFDKITGSMELKDNIAYKIDIKSYAPTLSALIRGRFDMDKHDASIRIYTRFSTDKKSMFGFLRNISLNALANKVQMNTRNDYNYYSAEIADLPQIEIGEEKSQIFLTQIEGDVEKNNYLSSLKKIK